MKQRVYYTLLLCLQHAGMADRSLRTHVAKTVAAHWITWRQLKTELQSFKGTRVRLSFLYSYCAPKHAFALVPIAIACVKRQWLDLLDDVVERVDIKLYGHTLWMNTARLDVSDAVPVLLKHVVFETELEYHLLPMACVVTHQARKCMQALWKSDVCTTEAQRRQLWEYMQKYRLAKDPSIWRTYVYEEAKFLKTNGGAHH